MTLLSKDLDRFDVKRIVEQLESLSEESEKRHGDSVLQVAMQENEAIFNEMKEEKGMCEALRKFFEPEMNEAVDKAVQNIILNALKAGNSVTDISRVMQISPEKIEIVAKGIE